MAEQLSRVCPLVSNNMIMQETASIRSRGKGLHRFAVLTACCTWCLIIAGALVTGNEAGLAVPDWPLSYGSLTPPMVGGIFFEHGHRLIAATVGLLTVILALWLWRNEPRQSVRRLGWLALGTVIAQGILGGITVLFFLPAAISIAHGCLAQAFFCMVVSLAWVTSIHWRENTTPKLDEPDNLPLRQLGLLALAGVYIQLMFGAYLRHLKSGITLHVVGALFVVLLIIWVFIRVSGRYAHVAALFRPAVLLILLLIAQLFLGIGSLWMRMITRNAVQPERLAVATTTAHVAVGALLLGTVLILTLEAFRLLAVPERICSCTGAAQKVTS
jgi:cytochrome c oxidase assembly protein subunit 15